MLITSEKMSLDALDVGSGVRPKLSIHFAMQSV